MNNLSLSFSDKLVETRYQNHKKELSQQLLKIQQGLVILILLYVLISSAFKQNWVSLCICGIGLILLIISVKLNIDRQEQCYLNNTIIIFMTIFNYYKSLQKILSETFQQTSYIDGYMLALATTSLLNQATFMQKCFIHISIYILLQIFEPNLIQEVWEQMILFLVYLTLHLIYLYKTEQISRQEYIQLIKHQNAEQQLVNQSGITLYIVNYKRDKNQILLSTYNNEDNITIQQQSQFISEIRNMKVFIKDQESQTYYKSQEEIQQDAMMTLEKFLFYFLSSPEKLKDYVNKFQINSLIKLQGVQNQENYNISIFKYFGEVPNAIILISQNKKDVFIEELKLRYKIFQQVLETIDDIFQSQVKMSLIYFKGLDKYQKVKSNNIDFCLYKKVQSKISKAYNDFQNIKDFFNLNSSFQRSIIQKFNFIQFLEEILIEIKAYFYQSKKFNYSITNKLKKDIVFQDQKQLKQLFLNLLYYISEHSQDIGIILEQGEDYSLKKQYFCIKIEFQGSSFSKDAIKGLPFINPNTLSELRHNAEQVYQLNLPMAIVIVRKLGPTNKIHIKQNNKNGSKSIEFFIFKELTEDFHLMPLKSQHPSNYLILNARSSIHAKHAAYFDLLSLSPRIQLDNFSEL
ncbi:unnamed protein product [Paramecium sonneborni]|uniref:Transmembrane protein n=1 Tax=Paramecium sonneborni TaxID=65129 RepID=A0A8S1QSM7_9CILI|nr:unnamed protein product [Paramecium sonneborni]